MTFGTARTVTYFHSHKQFFLFVFILHVLIFVNVFCFLPFLNCFEKILKCLNLPLTHVGLSFHHSLGKFVNGAL